MRTITCPTFYLNGTQISQAKNTNLGIYIDRHLNQKKHIYSKHKLKLSKIYWLGRNSQLTLKNKILLYKTILKSIWTYGILF